MGPPLRARAVADEVPGVHVHCATVGALRFSYYQGLIRRQKAIYRKSDTVRELVLPTPEALVPHVRALEDALQREERGEVQHAARILVKDLLRQLQVPPVDVRVLSRRPATSESELHGYYEHEDGKRAVIRVWMKTAAHRKTVAFRTFLRTLVHEVLHHVDYQRLHLEESLHTEGFFRRESSLIRQLAPARTRPSTRKRSSTAPPPSKRAATAAAQLELWTD